VLVAGECRGQLTINMCFILPFEPDWSNLKFEMTFDLMTLQNILPDPPLTLRGTRAISDVNFIKIGSGILEIIAFLAFVTNGLTD
jgi:hypothetical protein